MDKVARIKTRSKHIRFDFIAFVALFLVIAIAPNAPGWFSYGVGKLLPVVTPAKIIKVHDHGDQFSRLELEAEKLRSCAWREVHCYLGSRSGNSVPLTVSNSTCHFEDKPRVNEVGHLAWDQFIVGVPREQVPDVFADVLHLCPLYKGGKPFIPVITQWVTGSRAK